MTQKNQITPDSSRESGSEAFKKRAYQSPKLYVDLLKQNTSTKAGYNTYEAQFTRTTGTNMHRGGPLRTPGGQPVHYWIGRAGS
jgi:hypothetical protein